MVMTDCQPSFDYDDYLDGLPRHLLGPPQPNSPMRYQVSRFPLLKPFNGFTGIERRRGGQLATWLFAAGCIALPAKCDICSSQGPLMLHGENYYDVGSDPALCRPCHRSLHFRTFQWDAWRRLVDAASVTGREWFALAPRHGLDLAQHLRARFGLRVADIERSPLLPLTQAITLRLPCNMLPHPDL
jgi:hypothetical protein